MSGKVVFVVFSLIVVLTSSRNHVESAVGPPIVIVPGVLGNQLEARLNKTTSPHAYCAKNEDWYTIWLSLTQLLPYEVNCLTDNIKLHYDSSIGVYNNTLGVEIRVPGSFGDTSALEFLDPSTKWFGSTTYFYDMVQHFVDKGYVRGKDIVGASYDWRFACNEYEKQGYYIKLKSLIENTSHHNGNQKVVLIAHSMGSISTLYFLTKIVDQEWKEKYISIYVTMAGVWQGAAKSTKAFASGDNEGIIIDKDRWGRDGQRSYPSTAWLLPFPSEFWTSKDYLIVTPDKKYTAWDYEELFNDMKYPRGWDMFNEIKDLTGSMPPPNITHFCLYGYNMSTPLQFVYGPGEFPDTDPKTAYGDGDATVNIRSLTACKRWQGQQNYDVTLKGYPGVEHVHTIKNAAVIKDVDSIVYTGKINS